MSGDSKQNIFYFKGNIFQHEADAGPYLRGELRRPRHDHEALPARVAGRARLHALVRHLDEVLPADAPRGRARVPQTQPRLHLRRVHQVRPRAGNELLPG